MKKFLAAAALAASIAMPAAAQAQALPAAVIAVVNLERVTQECTACRTASAALRSQVTALETRQRALTTPLETEQRAIQTAINALNNAQPDAALQARVRAFETKRQQGAEEIARQRTQIQRNQQHISQQISTRLEPIYRQVMQRRGATVLLETGSTLATTASVDVSNDVLAALNAALPTIQTTAPAQTQQQPQGR